MTRQNCPLIKPKDFQILEEGVINAKDQYDCLIGYNSPFHSDQVPPHRPLFVKQFHGCDTIGPVEHVFVEFDNDGCPHLRVMVPTIPAAEAAAGGDSPHDFADSGWWNHQRSKKSVPLKVESDPRFKGKSVYVYVVRGIESHCCLRYLEEPAASAASIEAHEARGRRLFAD